MAFIRPIIKGGGGTEIQGAVDITEIAGSDISAGELVFLAGSGNYTKLESPSNTISTSGICINLDGTRLTTTSGSSPFLCIFDITTTPYTAITPISSVDLPKDDALCCCYNQDGSRLVVGHYGSPYLTIYNTTVNPYTKITPISISTPVRKCKYNNNGTRLAFTTSSSDSYIKMYTVSGDTYSLVPQSLPASQPYDIAFDPKGEHIMLGLANSPFLQLNNISGSKINDPVDILPSAACSVVFYNHDGSRFIAQNGNGISVYNSSTIPYIKLFDISTGLVNDGLYNQDSSRLIMGCRDYPYLRVYDTSTIPYTEITNINDLPENSCFRLTMSYDGTKLIASQSGISPYLNVYDVTFFIQKMSYAPIKLVQANRYGYCPEAITAGESGVMKQLFGLDMTYE